MSDDVALLAAIGEHPNEDTPRLVYADWLDEQGGEANAARAEFIRVECETARIGGWRNRNSPQFKQLLERAKQLVANYASEWLAEFPGVEIDYDSFSRGFVNTMKLDTRKCAGPRPPWHREPVAEVELACSEKGLRRLLKLGWFDGVTQLDLMPKREAVADAIAEAVCEYSFSRSLRSLSLWNEGYGDRSLRAISQVAFHQLRYLSCMGQFTAQGWRDVLDSPAADNLEDLTVGHRAHWQTADQTRPGPALADVLAPAPRLQKVRRLWVNGCGLGNAGITQFASRARLPALERLSIDNDVFGETAAQALAAAEFPALHSLSLSSCELNDELFEVIVRSPLIGQLEYLSVTLNRLKAASAVAIAMCGQTAKLKSIDFGCNAIGDEGVIALMQSPNFPALEQLHLSSTEMTDIGADAVAAAQWVEQLQTLFMSYNTISRRKQKALTAKFGEALWINGRVET